MNDAYHPALVDFQFSADEKSAISAALQTEKPWTWKPGGAQEEALKSAKKKIRDYHMARHANKCCYCRTNLYGTGAFMSDREHVLPKSKAAYRSYSYTMWNIGVSCKRCNFDYKKTYDNFVVDKVSPEAYLTAGNYLFVHPNFDRWNDHLKRSVIEHEDFTLVIYSVSDGSTKGQFTYDYFNLKGLEIGLLDKGQGAKDVEGGIADEVRALARAFQQAK